MCGLMESVHPRDDPWLTLPFGVLAAVAGAAVLAAGEIGLAIVLLVNALVALGRTVVLLRRPRRRPTIAEAVENAWLPVLMGTVVGAVLAGDSLEQIAAGVAAGAWVALCIAAFLSLYERRLGTRNKGDLP